MKLIPSKLEIFLSRRLDLNDVRMNIKRVSLTASIILIILMGLSFAQFLFGATGESGLVLAKSDLLSGDWTNRTFNRVSPDEVEETVSQMQYVPEEEVLRAHITSSGLIDPLAAPIIRYR